MAAQPIGRFYELQKEVKVPEPYVLTSKIKIKPPTRVQMIALRNAETQDDAERAMLGEHFDAVIELYADRPDKEYAAFVEELQRHMLGPGVDDVEGGSEGSSSS